MKLSYGLTFKVTGYLCPSFNLIKPWATSASWGSSSFRDLCVQELSDTIYPLEIQQDGKQQRTGHHWTMKGENGWLLKKLHHLSKLICWLVQHLDFDPKELKAPTTWQRQMQIRLSGIWGSCISMSLIQFLCRVKVYRWYQIVYPSQATVQILIKSRMNSYELIMSSSYDSHGPTSHQPDRLELKAGELALFPLNRLAILLSSLRLKRFWHWYERWARSERTYRCFVFMRFGVLVTPRPSPFPVLLVFPYPI